MTSRPGKAWTTCAVLVAPLLGLLACKSKAPPPHAEIAPQPTPARQPTPPPECAKDEDCVAANCCYALATDACMPASKSTCNSLPVECLPTNEPRFACTCKAGACAGTPASTPAPRASAAASPSNAGDSWASGALDAPSVLKVVMAHAADVKACHASAPKAVGIVSIAWEITPAGTVPKANVMATTAHSAPLEKCLVTKIRAWRFPARKAASRASYTFKFAK